MKFVDHYVRMVMKKLSDEERNHGVSPEKLEQLTEKIALVAAAMDDEFSAEDFQKELERQLQIRFEERSACIVGEPEGRNRHWLTEEVKKDRPFWSDYKQKIEFEIKLPANVCEEIDVSTDRILELTGDPKERKLATKGLVIGDVQSGKTSNFTGLISKAADAGYRVIIVTTGILEVLRRQTQERLERDFVRAKSEGNSLKFREMPSSKVILKTSCLNDFLRTQVGEIVTTGEFAYLFVVKKNVSVLQSLYRHIKRNPSVYQSCPLLFIDDEADNASINTNVPDPEVEPTKTNKRIRQILDLFPRSSYVGYTATPYANIFINPFIENELEDSENAMKSQDLFPRDFIYCLRRSSEYIGAEQLFGLGNEDLDFDISSEMSETPKYNVHVLASGGEEDAFVERLEKGGSKAIAPPQSLISALYTYLLAVAIHQHRGRDDKFSGMLIHVSRLTKAQNKVFRLIRDLLSNITDTLSRNALVTDAFLKEAALIHLREVWQEQYEGKVPEKWEDILRHLGENDFLAKFKTFQVNSSTSAEINKQLEKFDYSHMKPGTAAIVVGGNCLARGLTIEGLTVTYFLRKSKTYDALMQMGRWFGYRNGYEDICRIFIDQQVVNYFSQIAYATKELKESINHMNEHEILTPLTFGLKVRNGAGGLLITSRNKMRGANKTLDGADVDLSDCLLETYRIPREPMIVESNNAAMKELICELDAHYPQHVSSENDVRTHKGFILWKSVPTHVVTRYLARMKSMHWSPRDIETSIDEECHRILFDYLENCDDIDVTLVSLDPDKPANRGKALQISDSLAIYPLRRNPFENVTGNPEIVFNKSHVFSKLDEMGAITKDEEKLILEQAKKKSIKELSGTAFRHLPGRKPMLLLTFAYLPKSYLKDLERKRISAKDDEKLTELVCAYGLSCPASDSRAKMKFSYAENTVSYRLKQVTKRNEEEAEYEDNEDEI